MNNFNAKYLHIASEYLTQKLQEVKKEKKDLPQKEKKVPIIKTIFSNLFK